MSRHRTPPRPPVDTVPRVTRRNFLRVTGAALSGGSLPGALTACSPSDGRVGPGPSELPVDFTAHILRPDDMVTLEVGFVNLKLSADGTQLVRAASGSSYLIVTFPRQHLLEEAFWEEAATADKTVPAGTTLNGADPPPIKALLSGKSRVVFVVPTGVSTITYTTEGLLQAFADYDMSVTVNAPAGPTQYTTSEGLPTKVAQMNPALPFSPQRERVRNVMTRAAALLGIESLPSGSASADQLNPYTPPSYVLRPDPNLQPGLPFEPRNYETSIELPTRLELSPNPFCGWAHQVAAPTPMGAAMRTDLWHTRLGVRRTDGSVNYTNLAPLRTVRAVWTRDADFRGDPNQVQMGDAVASGDFEASLRYTDREKIVYQSGNFGDKTHQVAQRPVPIQVNQLMLTALGGFLDVTGNFGDKPATGLSLWEHKATLGRDHYVKTVQTGVLFPFGHRAVLVTISERKIHPGPTPIAYVWKRQFIVIKEPLRDFGGTAKGGGTVDDQVKRQLPFSRIEITTLVTPNLVKRPSYDTNLPVNAGNEPYYMPQVLDTNEYYRFVMVGTDRAGNAIKFNAPALWVPTFSGNLPPSLSVAELQNAYTGQPMNYGSIVSDLTGQRVAFATESGGDPDATTFETHTLTYGGKTWSSPPPNEVPYLPVVTTGNVAVEAVRQISGTDGLLDFTYHNAFTTNGFDDAANKGEVLLQLTDGFSVGFSSQSQNTGGFLAPDMKIRALSRKLGPVAGGVDMAGDAASDVVAGNFNPSAFFSELNSAKLFGVFGLGDVLKPALDGLLASAPKMITQALNEVESLLADLAALKQLFDQLQSAGTLPSELSSVVDAVTTLATDVTAPNLDAIPGDVTTLGTAVGAVPGVLSGAAGQVIPAVPRKQLSIACDKLQKTITGVGSKLKDLVNAYHEGEELVKNLSVKLSWRSQLQPLPDSSHRVFDPLPGGGLVLDAEIRAKASGGKPAGVDLVCGLESFDLNLIAGVAEFVSLHFKYIQFSIEAGKKPDIDVQFDKEKDGGIEFKGPLSFINTLRKIIPFDGFSDPPSLEVTTSGITGSFTLPIPSLAVGVFALQNISIGAGFNVPFIGDPLNVSFNFCTRENPFNLSVMMLGGGGFFGITLFPDRVHIIEASLEFGATLAVDFGVASGSVSIVAGVYFKLEDGAVTLTGYLRIRGEVDVLGLISASIELYMELTYESASGKVIGKASLDIEVHICFFSIGVTVTCEKKFAGGNADPTFAEAMGPCNENDNLLPAPFASCTDGYDPWLEYVGSFA